jgi:hypothetical protein
MGDYDGRLRWILNVMAVDYLKVLSETLLVGTEETR